VEFLIELDKLIQLIESPIFAGVFFMNFDVALVFDNLVFYVTRHAPSIVRIAATVGTIAVWNINANASDRCIPYSKEKTKLHS